MTSQEIDEQPNAFVTFDRSHIEFYLCIKDYDNTNDPGNIKAYYLYKDKIEHVDVSNDCFNEDILISQPLPSRFTEDTILATLQHLTITHPEFFI